MFKETLVSAKTVNRRKKIFGVGIIDVPYNIKYKGEYCPYCKVWASMICRCYSKNKREMYVGCTVCDNWLILSNFRRWMEKQDWKNMCLDKDILILGNKEYNPNGCVFVTVYINTMFQNTKHSKKLKGVQYMKNSGKYRVVVKTKHLGCYFSLTKANKVYIKAKAKVLADEFKNILDVRIKNGLYKLLLDLNKENKKKIKVFSV